MFSEGMMVIPSVWSMICKHDLVTNQVTKYKASLNLHGGNQEMGVNYNETPSFCMDGNSYLPNTDNNEKVEALTN